MSVSAKEFESTSTVAVERQGVRVGDANSPPGMRTLNETASVPFSRSRWLAALGTVMLGAALKLSAPDRAAAYHGNTPSGCFGYGKCHCCSGCTCCSSGCQNWGGSGGCPTGGQCWSVCVGPTLYRCCDWKSPAGPYIWCICRCAVGTCSL